MQKNGDFARIVIQSQTELSERLSELLLAGAFTNRHTLHPRRFPEIAEGILHAYVEFLGSGSAAGATELGRALALEGLGIESIEAMFGELRRYWWERDAQAPPELLRAALEGTESFLFLLIGGMMQGRESYILAEQERLRKAFDAAQAQGRDHRGA